MNFDNLAAGTAVTNQYQSLGVVFAGGFRVLNLDFAGPVIFPSPPNYVAVESSTASIVFVDPANLSVNAVTDSVTFTNNGLNRGGGSYSGLIVTARDINGRVLGTVRIEPVGPNQQRPDTPTSFAAEGIHEIDLTVIPNPVGASSGAMTGANGYIPVNNTGGGLMNWTATVSYLSGAGWLNLSPASGQNHNASAGRGRRKRRKQVRTAGLN